MKKENIFEGYEKTEDGWFGYLAEGYVTSNNTLTIFADTKKELNEQAKIEGVHKIDIEDWYKL